MPRNYDEQADVNSDQPERNGDISVQMGKLHDRLRDVESQIDMLAGKLDPVLCPPLPRSPTEAINQVEPESQMGSQLFELNRAADHLIDCLVDIRHRVDL